MGGQLLSVIRSCLIGVTILEMRRLITQAEQSCRRVSHTRSVMIFLASQLQLIGLRTVTLRNYL